MPAQTLTVPLIEGGSPTIFVSDLDRSVRFYTDALGLRIAFRAQDKFCMIDAGGGLMLGLHPTETHTPSAGTRGSIEVGLQVARPIEDVVDELARRGVNFHGRIIDDEGAVKLAPFDDPDGNALYLYEVLR